MHIEVPEGNVRVPMTDFQAVWDRAEHLFRDDQSSPYLGGVCAACRWVAGLPGAPSPVQWQAVAATPERILREDMVATVIAGGGRTGDPPLDIRWAAGVAMTLGWVRGALADEPLG